MTKLKINLNKSRARALDKVKSSFGLKNKAEAVKLIIHKFGEEILKLN